MIGKTLGHYEVLEQVGTGGMGEVYRARDTRLHRDVAIKIIPSRLLGDEEHRARFEREARLLASLNHPYIASIFGLEEHDGQFFLVLEFIAGADLAQRLARGPMPVTEVIRVAAQVADALESAHRQGVIHRDLKPSNIALATDGTVKVLDFGLAKALDPGSPAGSDTISQSPTLLGGATASNVILGTAAYMSPEQARGTPVDSRGDVWAFGCVVLECLTGRRAFEGESISDTLAAVLRDPIDWSRLPVETPPSLRRLLRRCLERDPARRLHSLADARLELEDAAEELKRGTSDSRVKAPTPAGRAGRWLPWVIVSALIIVLIALIARDRTGSSPPRVARFYIPVDSLDTSGLCPPAISPDGSRLVYSAAGHLWVRDIDRLDPRPLEGTDGARCAFWSPDGSVIGFQTRNRLWRVSVDGGHPLAICDTPENFGTAGGADWGEDDRIIFATGDGSIYQVSVSGGIPVSILDPDPARDDDFHSPTFLPEGRGVLFVPHPLGGARNKLDLLHDGKRRTIWEHPWDVAIGSPVYHRGYILFRREQPDPGIWAVAFSLDELRVEGDPFLIADEGEVPSVSRDGTLVYNGGGSEEHRLVRVDHEGQIQGEPLDQARHIDDAALSPSGTRLLEALLEGSQYTVVVRDLTRGTRSVVATGTAVLNPFWISDSSIGAVLSDSTLMVAYDLELATPPRVLFRGNDRGSYQRMDASPVVTPDREYVLFVLHGATTKSDLWIVPLDGSGEGRPILATPAREEDPQPSPTADLLAYVSDESGKMEVYLSRLEARASAPSRRWQVSSGGGLYPRWSHDGTRLYFESEDHFTEVEVNATDGVALSRPRTLFHLAAQNFELLHGYAVDPNDSTFLMIRVGDPAAQRRNIVVVQNWLEDFHER